MLVVNLLFFDIIKVIEIFEDKVYFYYLVYWGLVVVYWDLDDFKKVLKYVDKVLLEVLENLEVYYLKV